MMDMMVHCLLFQVTEKTHAVCETTVRDKERWMIDYSLAVDCINMVLNNGGKNVSACGRGLLHDCKLP